MEPSEVYLMKVHDNTNTNSSWALGFIGENKNGAQVVTLENTESFLFGRVVHGEDLVSTICGLNDFELSGYEFNLCWVL